MKPVVEDLMQEFKIYQLNYDFMGYTPRENDIYTYHHAIIPARKDGAMTRENGLILCGRSSHTYLHIIENYEHEFFKLITFEMLDMKLKGYLAPSNLKMIDEILREFEDRYKDTKTHKGKPLIKTLYRDRRKF